MDFNHIHVNIYVGSCPKNQRDIQQLRVAGITAILNLQSDDDLVANGIHWVSVCKAYDKEGIKVSRLPILDFVDGDLLVKLPEAVNQLQKFSKNSEKVLVHCNAGQQRSPSVVIAYLILNCGITYTEAVAHVIEARQCDPPLHVIRQFIPAHL